MDPEDEIGHAEHDGHGDIAGDHVGNGLSQDEFQAADGRDHDLLDGADLFFPDDADAGEQHAEDQQHGGDQRRDVIVFALLIGVEPGPGDGADLDGGNRDPLHILPSGLPGIGVGAGDSVGIAEGDGGGVAVGAVGDDLHGRRAFREDVALKISRDADHHLHLSAIEQGAYLLIRGQDVHHPEIPAGVEVCDQFPRGRGLVHVQDRCPDVHHVGGQRKGHDGHLDDGNSKDGYPHPGIAQHLQKFLDQHPLNPLQHRLLQFEAEFAVGYGDHDQGVDGQKEGVGPQDLKPDPLQVDTAQDGDEVAARNDIGQDLQRFRHILDGEDKA